MFVHELQHIVLLLLVNLLREDHLFVVINRIIYTFSRILCLLYLLEDFLYLLLYLIYINITYNDNSLKIGTIPLLVVVTKCLMREVVYNLHCTDWQAFAISAAGEDVCKHALLHTHHSGVASAPLFMDYTTLLVNLLAIECKAVSPVVKYPETRVYSTFNIHWNIVDVVDSLID